jgi:NTP pyrophosphatase (non-canonical NTP hydrolase)
MKNLIEDIQVKQLSDYNKAHKVGNSTYNHAKLLEEIMELGEVLSKGITKSVGKAPPVEKLIEEIGDVKIRIEMLIAELRIEIPVERRITDKLSKLDKYRILKSYKAI